MKNIKYSVVSWGPIGKISSGEYLSLALVLVAFVLILSYEVKIS